MTTQAHTLARSRATAGAVLAVLALCALLVAPSRSFASTIPLTVSERASYASTIFIARVGDHAAKSLGRGIVTGFGVDVDRVLKGDAPSRVNVMGGRVGVRRQWVSDQPALERGKTYVFFLDGLGRTIGGPQGAVEVQNGKLVGTPVSVAEVAEAVAMSTLTPQQARAFPELRTQAARSDAFAAIDSAVDVAAGAATDPTSAGAETTAAATTGPSITAISPDEVAAGIGTLVEIDGQGFGTVAGKIELVYDPQSGPSFARWPVSPASWTNTRITFRVPVFVDSTGYPGSAGTGPVHITTASGLTVDSPTLRVTYGIDGASWASTPVSVYVNPSATSSPPATLSMVQNAISTWAGGGFGLQYAGPSSATPSTNPSIHGNGLNEVAWSSLPPGILAQASWTGSGSHLQEQNIVFNTMYAWADGVAKDAGGNATFDVQSTALHELGHWVVLRDKYSPSDAAQVMYGYGHPGEQKRALTQAELDGIRYVYGSDRLAPVTPVSTASSAPFNGSWTSGDVTVTVTPPADANLRATRYRIDFGSAQTISAATDLPFTAEGYHDVMVWSTDDAGNNETPTHRLVGIDRTAPTSSSDATATYGGKAVIKFTGADSMSGLYQLQWRLVGSPTWTSTTAVTNAVATYSTPGSYALEFRAVDRAGIAEEPHVVSFDVYPLQPTALQLTTTSRNVKYGTALGIAGSLTANSLELVGQTVRLQSSANGSTWTNLASQVTGPGGAFSFSVKVSSTTYYRVTYSGGIIPGNAYAAVANPPSVKIGSTAYLTYPYASRVKTRTYDLWALLMPRHAEGSYPVRLYLYRYSGGRWVSSGYVTAKALSVGTSTTKTVRRYTFPSSGTWRVRAYHADAGHTATWSSYRTISVR